MTTMFNPNQPMTEEQRKVLEAMLKQSGREDQKVELENQRALGTLLGKSAIGYEPLGGGSSWGGFAGALAKGLQGYMGGTRLHKSDKDYADYRQQGIDNRQIYMDALMGGGQKLPMAPQFPMPAPGMPPAIRRPEDEQY